VQVAWLMRKIEIIEEPEKPYPWVAVDRKTREPLLRLVDVSQLQSICKRLGWEIVENRNRRNGAPARA
jgi:hypothetical protein